VSEEIVLVWAQPDAWKPFVSVAVPQGGRFAIGDVWAATIATRAEMMMENFMLSS
jgi:hypothetical protein